MPTKQQCRELWERNRDYVEANIDSMHIADIAAMGRKQDALYLAWVDGDFSQI